MIPTLPEGQTPTSVPGLLQATAPWLWEGTGRENSLWEAAEAGVSPPTLHPSLMNNRGPRAGEKSRPLAPGTLTVVARQLILPPQKFSGG